MKTRDLIILEIAAGQRERSPRTLREIAAELDIPFNTVKDHFAAYSSFAPDQRLHNGDLVLDPTIGSGTTAIAARLDGRDWIGIEKDEGYFEIAKARIEERLKQPFLPGLVEAQPEKPEQQELF